MKAFSYKSHCISTKKASEFKCPNWEYLCLLVTWESEQWIKMGCVWGYLFCLCRQWERYPAFQNIRRNCSKIKSLESIRVTVRETFRHPLGGWWQFPQQSLLEHGPLAGYSINDEFLTSTVLWYDLGIIPGSQASSLFLWDSKWFFETPQIP